MIQGIVSFIVIRQDTQAKSNFTNTSGGARVVHVKDSKMSRVNAITPKLQSGRVKLLAGLWVDSFTDQVTTFRNAKRDDQVDVLQMAVATLLLGTGNVTWFMGLSPILKLLFPSQLWTTILDCYLIA